MIVTVNEKRLVFGMTWLPVLSRVQVHKEARSAKSPFLWHAEKSFFYGLLGPDDRTGKFKQPLYSGAIALQHMFYEHPNVLLALRSPDGDGYIVCGIHQSRPRDRTDIFVQTDNEVGKIIDEFTELCGSEGFHFVGDVPLMGIHPLSIEELADSADQVAHLDKAKSTLVNPITIGMMVIAVGFGISTARTYYIQYRNAEIAKKAAAQQKNAQQLYDEELARRRAEVAIDPASVVGAMAWIRALSLSNGGWDLTKVTCNAAQSKEMACALDYARSNYRQATNKTFLDKAGKFFNTVEFSEDSKRITATATIKALPFTTTGAMIDAAKNGRETMIEFGSMLQGFTNIGDQKLTPFKPFALPAAANVGELTKPPIMFAGWEFNGPLRSLDTLNAFPKYLAVKQFTLVISPTAKFELNQSFVTLNVSGDAFAKPI